MIKQLINVGDQPFILACSGGVDSMAIADFYKRGNKNFTVAYFNHQTPNANAYEAHVKNWAAQNNVGFHTGTLTGPRRKRESLEEYWRIQRYDWLLSFGLPLVTCHHLDDAVETWIFSTLNGRGRLPAVRKGMIIRPFLSTRKSELVDWCIKHGVKWIEDVTNENVLHPRNRIRHLIVPQALKINPGLHKVIKKKVIASYK